MDKALYDSCIAYLQAQEYEKGLGCIEHIYEEDHEEGRILAKKFRVSMKKVLARGGEWTKRAHDLIYRSYLMSARDYLDDFMIAVEYFRPIERQFWLPRREKLLVICNALQDLEDDKLDELFISQPPRTGKTTMMIFFTVWVILRNSERTNIYTSYTKDVVDTFYNGVLEILTDDMTYAVEEVFPLTKLASTNQEKGFINVGRKNKHYASLMCRAVGQATNGMTDADAYIILDDLHSGILEARNPDLLLGTWQVVNNNILSRRKDKTKFLWIGTRWSVYDAISQRIDLLETSPQLADRRYKVVNVPDMNENDESNFDYPYGLGFSSDTYKEIRAAFEAAGDYESYLAQYRGTPVERNGAVFEPDSLWYYNGELPKEEPDRVIMVVDPSWGGGDYVSAPVFVQYDTDLYLSDIVFSTKDKYITEPMIVECAIRNKVQAMYVEGTRVTGSYAEDLDKRFKDAGYHVNLQRTTKHWSSQSGKAQRIYDKAPEIRQKVIFRDSKHRNKDYQQAMQQLYAFTVTGKVKHDDFPDSLAMAMVMTGSGLYAKARVMRRFF